MRHLIRLVLCSLVLGAATVEAASGEPAHLPAVKPAVACGTLAALDLASIGGVGSRVTSATETTSDGIDVCAVDATLAPAIAVRVLLPTKTWTQRYMQLGCGGLCGRISLMVGAADGCKVVTDGGFAMAATDMGHSGGMDDDGSWAADPQKRVDFAYRAEHLTAAAAKALILAFYGQPQRYAYFNGCSDGGREALMEAQRFPEDFQGVIAGAPAMLFQVQNTLYHAWQATSNTGPDGKAILLSSRLPLLHDAVLVACDSLDGAKDGLIADPAACHFDVSGITCAAGESDTSACLSEAEATVVRKFYAGPIDTATGEPLTAGQPQYGSELEWAGVYVPDRPDGMIMSRAAALPAIRYVSFEKTDPAATLASLPFTLATLDRLRPLHPLYDATNPDLSAFRKAGAKLILWHGLADPHISPANTVSYHRALVERLGGPAVGEFERLYLLPGVAHCGNGQGPGNLDLLTAMMGWVEGGVAPDAIETRTSRKASQFGAPNFGPGPGAGSGHETDRRGPPPPVRTGPKPHEITRPVYPYPAVARHAGSGSVFDAADWTKGGPAEQVRLRPWPGSDLFAAYRFIDR